MWGVSSSSVWGDSLSQSCTSRSQKKLPQITGTGPEFVFLVGEIFSQPLSISCDHLQIHKLLFLPNVPLVEGWSCPESVGSGGSLSLPNMK